MSTRGFRGKQLTTFSGFRGVDFSSSPLDVDARRASEMENFISDFGILKKRNGWQQEREFTNEAGERLPVCGIFPYKNGDISHVIVHAGDRFLRLTENGYERVGTDLTGITATRSEAYMQKGRMYIVGCGDFLAYGTWDGGKSFELRSVCDGRGGYIPRTTVNISSKENAAAGAEVTLDDVNLLTPWRRNGLNGVLVQVETGSSENTYSFSETFYPDARFEMFSPLTVRALKADCEVTLENEYEKVFFDAEGYRAGVRRIDALGNVILIFDREEWVPKGEFHLVVNGEDCTCSEGAIRYTDSGKSLGAYTVDATALTLTKTAYFGTLYDRAILVESSENTYEIDTSVERTVTLFRKKEGEVNPRVTEVTVTVNYLTAAITLAGSSYGGGNFTDPFGDFSYQSGEDVFEVEFPAVLGEEEGVIPYRERVKNCTFGVVFGVDGASDRLFLTGNPALKNVEFFSDIDDYTYFPDTNTITVGSDDAAIVGYMRLSDGTLALFKERCAGDATIYYRTSYYKQYNDDEGDLERIDAIFPTTAGNIGEAMLSRFASADFGGDKLFLSENGVFSVVLATNVATAERYSRERSRAVNARLVREVGLERTVATVYKDKYYLAVNGNVYVADARYRHTRADSMDGAWGYEWYFLTNIPANVFREIDGVLWFGTRDGRLCRFDEAYSDRTYALFEPGELTLFRESAAPPFFDGLTVNVTRHTALAVGDVFTTNAALFAVTLTDFVRVEGVRIYHRDLLRLAKLPEGLVVRVHGASEGAGLVSGEDYELRDIDLQEGCFSLYKDGAPVAVTSASFSLLRALKGLSLDVLAVEGSHVRLGLWGEPLVLVSDVALLTGKLWHREAVQARWISTVTDLGTSMAGKSLHRLSITCEPTVRGRVTFGYNTRLGSPARFTSAGSTLFSLSDLDFQSFSFETGFASSYSLKIFERNVNYLALAVESNTDTACAFNRLELLWSLGRYLEGLR